MSTGMPDKREDTILGLSLELNTLLEDFHNRLDSRFHRIPGSECGGTPRPENPNVLDEIIDELSIARGKLSSIMSLIETDVFPKIN